VIRKAVLLGAALLAASHAFAQAPQGPGPLGPPEGRPREEVFKMVDAYILSNLQESLGLSDEQFVRLLPLVKRLQTDRRSFAQRRQRALQELRRVMQTGTATDARVGELLKELKAAEAEEPVTIRKDSDAIDGALTPLQQAKYRLLEVEVDRRLRELMNQVRRNTEDAPRQRRNQLPPR
jgi:Spy/CpxP family protein refolding chaperone